VGVCGGLVLFIIPGLYLLSRWSLSPVLVLTSCSSAREALARSWRATRRCAWKLLFLFAGYLTIWTLVIITIVSIGEMAENHGIISSAESSPIWIVSLATTVAFGVAASAYVKVAVYEWLVGRRRQLQAVFA
jgi:hypothetical protein